MSGKLMSRNMSSGAWRSRRAMASAPVPACSMSSGRSRKTIRISCKVSASSSTANTRCRGVTAFSIVARPARRVIILVPSKIQHRRRPQCYNALRLRRQAQTRRSWRQPIVDMGGQQLMHVVVCVKQTPDSAAKVSVESGKVTWGDASLVVNPWDEYAIEEAIRLKEKHGGKASAISMGPESAKEALKTCL